ncbi:hypothetical protein ACJMK2_043683 [Sinanodonta woodiana]|uniref:SOCS box domain-containing protein n=1 Tax=Sinanodonta woodiana TaxID=1069815 RepID=A0ABD3W186_SINWO
MFIIEFDCLNEKVAYDRDIKMSTRFKDTESELFEAIFNGDLVRVRQLIDSGINKNTVLHNPARWEGATILGTAAIEGHLDIVKYLIQQKVSVNFTDPCLGRTALHWACMVNRVDIVRHMLDNGSDVNICDKDNTTPLIKAVIHKCKDIVKLLIERGADVNQVDRLRSSALHYATFIGIPQMVSDIIRGGCVDNTESILGKGTPLSNLMHSEDIENINLLLDAGYNTGKDKWLMKWDDVKDPPNKAIRVILLRYRNPPSLQHLCRKVVRDNMNGRFVSKKIRTLPLPPSLRSFLLLES